ncbi:tetratricopeptide repeat protein [Pseudoroseicyclus sp. H15]
MKHVLAALALALCPLTAGAQEIELSPAELRAVAVQVLREGNPWEAVRLSQLLLQRDPYDDVAAYVKAEALLALGRPELAARFGKAAFRNTEEDILRFQAARLTALAQSQSGNLTWAQLWLRRATPYVPDPQARAELERDYRLLRAANPLSLSFGFSVTPTQNINGGSAAETIQLPSLPGIDFVLSPDARPLSGVQFYGSANLSYRLAETERTRTSFELEAEGRTYALSRSAQETLDNANIDASGSDYSDATLTIGLERVVAPETGPDRLTFGIDYGQVWYGGDPLRDFLRLDGEMRFLQENGGALVFSGEAEYQREAPQTSSSGAPAPREEYWTLNTRLRHILPASDFGRLTLTYELEAALTDEPDTGYTSFSLGGEYSLNEPVTFASAIGPLGVSFGGSLEPRFYEDTIYASGERQDIRGRTYLTLDLPKFEVYGFVPSVTLEANHTWSNVDFFERDDVRLSLDFRSAF